MTLPASFKAPRGRRTESSFGSQENHSTRAQGLAISLTKSKSFTQHSQSVLRAKDMILMLLYGLEMFLCVWDVQQLQQASNGRGEAYI